MVLCCVHTFTEACSLSMYSAVVFSISCSIVSLISSLFVVLGSDGASSAMASVVSPQSMSVRSARLMTCSMWTVNKTAKCKKL